MSYQLLPGFRVRTTEKPVQGHWQGGAAYHHGAKCPICRRPLLLLWDLNATDPRFVLKDRPAFPKLSRLPLYYCWTCCAEMTYRVTGDTELTVISNTGSKQGKGFPYENYPREFPRVALDLGLLSEAPQAVRKAATQPATKKFSQKERKPIERWLGHKAEYGFDVWWQQFGGEPWLVQGPESIVCPNETCSYSRRQFAMKILAAIVNDPPGGLPMIEPLETDFYNHQVQVIFHICRACLTIHACNRCD